VASQWQWRSQKCELVWASFPSFSLSFSLSSTSLPLPPFLILWFLSLYSPFLPSVLLYRNRTPIVQLGVWSRTVIFLSGVPTEIEFGALKLWNWWSGGNSFNRFRENQLTKLAHLVQFELRPIFIFMFCLEYRWGWRLGFLGSFVYDAGACDGWVIPRLLDEAIMMQT